MDAELENLVKEFRWDLGEQFKELIINLGEQTQLLEQQNEQLNIMSKDLYSMKIELQETGNTLQNIEEILGDIKEKIK